MVIVSSIMCYYMLGSCQRIKNSLIGRSSILVVLYLSMPPSVLLLASASTLCVALSHSCAFQTNCNLLPGLYSEKESTKESMKI